MLRELVRTKNPLTMAISATGSAGMESTVVNLIEPGECFGEMAYIRGGALPRHATVESTVQLLLAEFEPAALDNMSTSAQLQLTRALVRNLAERLELANTRLK